MENRPLQPLHLATVLSQAKLNHYARLTTEELIRSLAPGQLGALVLMELLLMATTGLQFCVTAELKWTSFRAKCC